MTDQPAPELQAAQDMLSAVCNQRNASQNECVQLAAQVQAAQRKIAELEAKIKELAAPEASNENVVKLATNGRDPDFEAVMQ